MFGCLDGMCKSDVSRLMAKGIKWQTTGTKLTLCRCLMNFTTGAWSDTSCLCHQRASDHQASSYIIIIIITITITFTIIISIIIIHLINRRALARDAAHSRFMTKASSVRPPVKSWKYAAVS